MVIGTFHFAQVAISASSRSFDRWTIWLTAKGAERRSGLSRSHAASSSVMRCSHSSSSDCGRAFRAGKLPTMPALHCAMRSEEHTSEVQSLMRISYAVFCLKKKTHTALKAQDNSDQITTHYQLH